MLCDLFGEQAQQILRRFIGTGVVECEGANLLRGGDLLGVQRLDELGNRVHRIGVGADEQTVAGGVGDDSRGNLSRGSRSATADAPDGRSVDVR